VHGLGPTEMVRIVLFPAALPEIFTGLRVGFSLTLIGTLLGEMFAAQRGLGYLLMTAIGLHNVERIMAVKLILFVFAAAVSSVLLASTVACCTRTRKQRDPRSSLSRRAAWWPRA
jgi:NitT/TauT family transport system permease protein